ncbi:MAG: DUF6090 family protein [Saprospiraceae bacterium]|nr:DUF6090 family protein [Saprospiraceae bacterium]
MLKFFRKIRQKLLLDNKFSKYALYAVGEIFLVVIGILIALQINNWNTNKQETKELYSYLSNIRKNLQEDLTSVEEIKEWRESSIMRSKRYMEVVHINELTFFDFNEILRPSHLVFRDFNFISNTSGIEALKSSGFLRKLHSTSLAGKLNEYYNIVNKILREENSLNNTIENLQIFTYNDNILQQLFQVEGVPDKQAYFSKNIIEIRELLFHPSLTGAHERNSKATNLLKLYSQLEEMSKITIAEINTFTKYN